MPPSTGQDYSNLYIPGAIIIAGVIIGVSLIVALGGGGFGGGGTGGTGGTVDVNIKDVDIEGHPYIGAENAPVTMAYWSDYQCPFCKAFEVGGVDGIPNPPVMPTLIKDYVDTGKLKIVFKDFAFLSEDSNTAALWGRAMWDLYPQKYWEWREAMYHAQDEEHGGFGDEASIVALTKKIAGVDTNSVKARVASNGEAYTEVMDADKTEAAKFGINGTPGFITGKVLLPGFMALEDFKKAIDDQL